MHIFIYKRNENKLCMYLKTHAYNSSILSFTESLHGVNRALMVLCTLFHTVVTITFGVSIINLRAVGQVTE